MFMNKALCSNNAKLSMICPSVTGRSDINIDIVFHHQLKSLLSSISKMLWLGPTLKSMHVYSCKDLEDYILE